jgi:nitrogen fixation NifU-like protein
MYSAQLLRYFQDGRHAGELEQPNASAQVENPVCGDVLRLTAKIQDRRLIEVRYKAKGCVPAMACGSALADLLQGCSLDDAGRLNQEQLLAAVGGVPEASEHAGHLAMDALGALLKSAGVR